MLGSSSSSAAGNSGSSSGSSSGSNGRKKISDTYANQITILRLLSGGASTSEGRHYQIHEIAELSGLRDERETQRFLYILEGQKLVSPHPAGDFTSRHWYITKEGLRALNSMEASIA